LIYKESEDSADSTENSSQSNLIQPEIAINPIYIPEKINEEVKVCTDSSTLIPAIWKIPEEFIDKVYIDEEMSYNEEFEMFSEFDSKASFRSNLR